MSNNCRTLPPKLSKTCSGRRDSASIRPKLAVLGKIRPCAGRSSPKVGQLKFGRCGNVGRVWPRHGRCQPKLGVVCQGLAEVGKKGHGVAQICQYWSSLVKRWSPENPAPFDVARVMSILPLGRCMRPSTHTSIMSAIARSIVKRSPSKRLVSLRQCLHLLHVGARLSSPLRAGVCNHGFEVSPVLHKLQAGGPRTFSLALATPTSLCRWQRCTLQDGPDTQHPTSPECEAVDNT